VRRIVADRLLYLPDAPPDPPAAPVTAIAGPVAATAERVALGASRARLRRRRSRLQGLRTGLQAVLIALWCLLPVYWMLVASIREPGEVYATSLWPARITLGNYVQAFDPYDLLLSGLFHSLWISSLVTVVVLLLGVSGAYAIARLPFRGRGLIVGAILAASMLPGVSLLTPLFAFFSTVGWAATFQALIIPYIALAMPFAVYTLSTFFSALPWELEDAALIDGCNRAQSFVLVLLPLMVPAVVTVGLLTFIATWNEYIVASVLSVQPTITVTVVVANFSAQLTGGAATMAAGVVAAAPLVILVLVFQRRITAGLTSGSLKG
jgi:multiple sugar transport system permease protein